MEISDLINNPNKLKGIFERTLFEENKEIANLLVDYIDDPWLIFQYANYIVKGKVDDKLEEIIARDAASSYHYAVNVLNAPFPKGEEAISRNSVYNTWYKDKFSNKYENK